MPPVLDPCNIYSADAPGDLTGPAKTALPLIYVPNGLSYTVSEIDPTTYTVVRTFAVGVLPQHVVPSWDLSTLWVTNDESNSVTPIDPTTGLPGPSVPVADPYNMYFTPDGRYAIVVAEALDRLDFRDPKTMALVHSLPVDCPGVDHMDFSADGTYLIASCEFAGELLKVNVATQTVVGRLSLGSTRYQPQDVKVSPDGKVFYVADQLAGGVWEIDGASFTVLGFLPTGAGAHGLYPSRDAQDLYVSNRDAGSISVVDFATRTVVATWQLPPESAPHLGAPEHASPDMGGVSADGKVLWLSGRYNSDVYAIDTTTGSLIARIPVGDGPHGLCVWPQPGRYSLGHTGILR
jgi:YVTN family beta-propeller protein